ncbi:CHASE domain-containing protein [Lacisediminimonas profundi]|uniref:CHASE domain-containing protein n=1 Tax=Lacisediminimonas profundi TaxID=2603856 RepID=UPI00124B57FB|nr:CHASE domain-containing protein [Lacisediminimonas profundi]
MRVSPPRDRSDWTIAASLNRAEYLAFQSTYSLPCVLLFHPVTHSLEPFRGTNLRAFGYDMFAEPFRRAAMESARDTGRATLSGKVGLAPALAKSSAARARSTTSRWWTSACACSGTWGM